MGTIVGNIIAAIMIAHIGNSAPKVTIGIMFMPTGRPITSTPDIRAIMNNTTQAAMIAAKNPSHRMARIGNLIGDTVTVVPPFDRCPTNPACAKICQTINCLTNEN